MTISEEAVKAAVTAWDHHWGDRYGDEAYEEMGEEVRVALDAAAPFIRAETLERAAEDIDWIRPEMGPGINITPYRAGRHDALTSAASWLRARAAAVRGGE